MKKLPISENNPSPSIAVFDPVNPESVRTRLIDSKDTKMPTNGHNLESLRDLSSMNRMDSIDKVGVATHLLSESAGKYSKSGLYSYYIKNAQRTNKK